MTRKRCLEMVLLCLLVVVLVSWALFLGGCSNASKKTQMSLPQEVQLTISTPVGALANPGETWLTEGTPLAVHIEQKVTLSGLDLVTDTEQTPKADGKLALPLGMGGSAPTANVAGELDQGDIDTTYDKDDSQENVGNPQDNSVDNSKTGVFTPDGVNNPESGGLSTATQLYNSVFTVENIRTLGKRTWERFAKNTTTPGSTFGGPVLVKWPEVGEEFFVPNAAIDYAPNGSAGNAWACGTMSDPGESQGETGGVWGPLGATYYEIHYNK